MIVPAYPDFINIDPNIAKEIDNVALEHEETKFTSDFSFNSLVNWSVGRNQNLISRIKSSYILKIFDIINEEYFYTPFTYSQRDFCAIQNIFYEEHKSLDLVQSYLLDYVDEQMFSVTNNICYDDYIINVRDYINAYGSDYRWIRKKINNFKINNLSNFEFSFSNFSKNDIAEIKIFLLENFTFDTTLKKSELEAILNCFDNIEYSTKFIGKAYSEGKLIAANILEYHNPTVLISNYNKAINSYRVKGFSEYFQLFICNELTNLGFQYINLEQDIGLLNLRESKLSYKPDKMVKKYRLEPLS
jgi:hypothetical protein